MVERYVDARETPLRKGVAAARNYLVIKMEIGDYMAGNTVVEYKEDDFMSFDGRLRSQLEEISQSGMKGFLVVGRNLDYVLNEALDRNLSKSFVYGMIGSLCDLGFPPIFCGSFQNAFEVIDKIMEKTNDGKDRSSTYVPFRKMISKRDYKMRLLTSFSGLSMTRVDQILNSPFDFDLFWMLWKSFPLPYFYDWLDDETIYALGIGGLKAVMEDMLNTLEGFVPKEEAKDAKKETDKKSADPTDEESIKRGKDNQIIVDDETE